MSDVFNVLIACEESQTVCKEFRKLGHRAFSCDIQVCSGGHPEWHILGDCLPLLDGRCTFTTMDGKIHQISGKWDIIIAHPPCTYLTVAGACNIPSQPGRIDLGFDAKKFFIKILNSDCPRICVENPPPIKMFNLPRYTQLVRPYMFGDKNNKPICLWLKGLYPLQPVNSCLPDNDIIIYFDKFGNKKSVSRWYYETSGINSSYFRSKFFLGVARAMAEQFTSSHYQYSFFD